MQDRCTMNQYRPTESKYKGGADELYVTYDLEQRTRGDTTAIYPKVKRVYIAGEVKDWAIGDFTKKSSKAVHGVRIEYEQRRSGYHRRGFTATRGTRRYSIPAADVKPATQTFTRFVEVPSEARNVRFHKGALPERYREALQDVR